MACHATPNFQKTRTGVKVTSAILIPAPLPSPTTPPSPLAVHILMMTMLTTSHTPLSAATMVMTVIHTALLSFLTIFLPITPFRLPMVTMTMSTTHHRDSHLHQNPTTLAPQHFPSSLPTIPPKTTRFSMQCTLLPGTTIRLHPCSLDSSSHPILTNHSLIMTSPTPQMIPPAMSFQKNQQPRRLWLRA